MSSSSLGLTDALSAYIREVGVREHPTLAALRKVTACHPNGGMQISPEQGGFMQLLVRLLGARRCIEVGTFTGYSTLAVALALPEDGELIACDVSLEFTRIGQPFWEKSGVASRIDLRIAPAIQTLSSLIDEGHAETFDFAFIDADKENYGAYVEHCLTLLRPGGLLAVDNVLWGGSVIDPENTRPSTRAIRALNDQLANDERIDLSLVPIGDGLTLARKR